MWFASAPVPASSPGSAWIAELSRMWTGVGPAQTHSSDEPTVIKGVTVGGSSFVWWCGGVDDGKMVTYPRSLQPILHEGSSDDVR